jgi:hypothetical protein
VIVRARGDNGSASGRESRSGGADAGEATRCAGFDYGKVAACRHEGASDQVRYGRDVVLGEDVAKQDKIGF